MNENTFIEARNKIIEKERAKNGIGTLSEKTLHAVLKHYFEPCVDNHEIRVGNFVADIHTPEQIIEIQTRSFDRLRKKLEEFMKIKPVLVVYPIAQTKWLSWVDMETGEISKRRKSPKIGKPYEVFKELYKIKWLLNNERLKLCIVMLEIEEIRYLNGWSYDKKRGSSRCDSIPVAIKEEIYIKEHSEYVTLIPEGLSDQFTVKDYKAAAKITETMAQVALNVLFELHAVNRIGKKGNAYIYERGN